MDYWTPKRLAGVPELRASLLLGAGRPCRWVRKPMTSLYPTAMRFFFLSPDHRTAACAPGPPGPLHVLCREFPGASPCTAAATSSRAIAMDLAGRASSTSRRSTTPTFLLPAIHGIAPYPPRHCPSTQQTEDLEALPSL